MISVDIKIEKAYKLFNKIEKAYKLFNDGSMSFSAQRYRAEIQQPERLGTSFASYVYDDSIEGAVRQLAEAYGAQTFEVVGRFKASGPNVDGPWVGRIFVNESLALGAALRQIATLAAVDQAVDSNARRIYDIARNAIIAVEG